MADATVSPGAISDTALGRSEAPAGVPTPSIARRLGAQVRLFFRVMRANPLTFVGFLLVVVIAVTALLEVVVPALTGALAAAHIGFSQAVGLSPYTPSQLTGAVGQAPSFAHPFGTDNIGRDMFSQVVAALPLDLTIGFTVAGAALILGGVLGLVAGYWDKPGTAGGAVSVVIMRLTDIFLAFPSLVLALAVAASLGRSTVAAIIAILVTWWPYYVRLTRGEVLAVKNQPYVTAAKAAGVSDLRILVRHILRNILEPLTVYYTMDVGTVLVTFSTISYVGIGVPSNIPEWGNLIQQYTQNSDLLTTLPWTVLAPGAAVFVTVLAFSLLGDGLRDILDPRSRRVLAETSAVRPTGAQRS